MHRYKPCNAKGNSKKRVHTRKCLSENHSTEVLARKHAFFCVTTFFLSNPHFLGITRVLSHCIYDYYLIYSLNVTKYVKARTIRLSKGFYHITHTKTPLKAVNLQ